MLQYESPAMWLVSWLDVRSDAQVAREGWFARQECWTAWQAHWGALGRWTALVRHAGVHWAARVRAVVHSEALGRAAED